MEKLLTVLHTCMSRFMNLSCRCKKRDTYIYKRTLLNAQSIDVEIGIGKLRTGFIVHGKKVPTLKSVV